MKKIAVFASGRGSNFRNICESARIGYLPAEVNLLIASAAQIGAVEIANEYKIPVEVYSVKAFSSREEAEQNLLQKLRSYGTDIVALAGWMKLIGPTIVSSYPGAMVNIHPALLPFFGGKGMYGHHVHQAVCESGMQVSGATVHFVNERYDEGKILLQRAVAIETTDSPEEIAAKVLKIEHKIYPLALKLLVEGRVKEVNNRIILEKPE
jgi:phosphoribosylglycinamide formyltransferase-1